MSKDEIEEFVRYVDALINENEERRIDLGYLDGSEQKYIRTVIDAKGVDTGFNIKDCYEDKEFNEIQGKDKKFRRSGIEPFGVPAHIANFHPEPLVRDLNKCPKCGSLTKTVLYSTTTLLAYVSTSYDEEGNLKHNPNPNTTTNYYRCDKCGENYSGKN